jgi:Flp pilus assembly protein TadG
MVRFLRELIRDQKGNAMAIFAAALVPLTVVIGSGLDLSFAYMAKAKLQNACDAAVLAGRQSMTGTVWATANKDEADKFFDFNFPEGTLGTTNLVFNVNQNANDAAEILGTASATVPTSLMFIFGYDNIPVVASCDAKRDQGHNDVMLVLDVTGSMNNAPSIGGDTKIVRLRNGAAGLYRALQDTTNTTTTRFGIMPYSHTVNVGRSLRNRDIIKEQLYASGEYTYQYCDTNGYYIWDCVETVTEERQVTGFFESNTKYRYMSDFDYDGEEYVNINRSTWNLGQGGTVGGNRQAFRTSGDACIEERSSIGQGDDPIVILQTVSQSDIDDLANNGNDKERQFGRYDPGVQAGYTQDGCPSEASKMQEYASETAFNNAIAAATARVTGGTYHDIGMLWGFRFISQTGFFSSDNPSQINNFPVNPHIVFMTDGRLDTGGTLYSAYGVDTYQDRIDGSGTRNEKHIARFHSICDLAKANGITIWVIALDVTDTDDIDDCATSDAHFYTSDGSDLEQIFERIGSGIGNLRLTR